MDIFFLRHGETNWNHEHRLQGRTRFTDLTDFGIQLAEMTRTGIDSRGLRFDRIYTSPLTRARHTADIIAATQNCPLVEDDRLLEMSFGPYEGSTFGNGIWADDNVRNLFQNPAAYIPPAGAESIAQVDARVDDFLTNEILPLANTCDHILAVCHGAIMRAVIKYALHNDISKFWAGRQPNCCYHRLVLRGGKFVLEENSSVFYDQDLAAKVPSV